MEGTLRSLLWQNEWGHTCRSPCILRAAGWQRPVHGRWEPASGTGQLALAVNAVRHPSLPQDTLSSIHAAPSELVTLLHGSLSPGGSAPSRCLPFPEPLPRQSSHRRPRSLPSLSLPSGVHGICPPSPETVSDTSSRGPTTTRMSVSASAVPTSSRRRLGQGQVAAVPHAHASSFHPQAHPTWATSHPEGTRLPKVDSQPARPVHVVQSTRTWAPTAAPPWCVMAQHRPGACGTKKEHATSCLGLYMSQQPRGMTAAPGSLAPSPLVACTFLRLISAPVHSRNEPSGRGGSRVNQSLPLAVSPGGHGVLSLLSPPGPNMWPGEAWALTECLLR